MVKGISDLSDQSCSGGKPVEWETGTNNSILHSDLKYRYTGELTKKEEEFCVTVNPI